MTDRKIDWRFIGFMVLSGACAFAAISGIIYEYRHPVPKPPNAQVNAQRAEHAYIIPPAEAEADEQSLRTRLDYADEQLAAKDAEIAALRKENARLRKHTAPVNPTCLVTRMDNGWKAVTECGTPSKDAAPLPDHHGAPLPQKGHECSIGDIDRSERLICAPAEDYEPPDQSGIYIIHRWTTITPGGASPKEPQ